MVELNKIVEGAFSMDTLGIKDKVRSAGLSKNFKKPKEEWSPMELEVDKEIWEVLSNRQAPRPQTGQKECEIQMKSPYT